MWTGAAAYDQLMGRWSQRLSPQLVQFADVHNGDKVLDVGCGTGSLTVALLDHGDKVQVTGVDAAAPYIELCRQRIEQSRATLELGDAQELTYLDNSFDRCLSLLVFNFIPDARKAAEELCRVTRKGGTITAAVWDYGEGMEMLRILWDTAVELDPSAESKHESNMPLCREGELAALWTEIGLRDVKSTSLTVEMNFETFAEYWSPFLSGVGPSGSYVSGLDADAQNTLREKLCEKLSQGDPKKPIRLRGRAWAVSGGVPG